MSTQPTRHSTGTREAWRAARLQLLDSEKELTRLSDEVARQRQALPWVPITKPYVFDTEDGNVSLADLFRGRSQLLVYHFMLGPDSETGCPACSAIADGFNGIVTHLAHHDVMLWAVSRAPLAKLQAFRKRMGWTFPWASSNGADFNYDFNVSFTETQQRDGQAEYNYRPLHAASEPAAREMPGMSAFALQDGVVHHSYSAYARGLDGVWSAYQWLDRAPLGRNESDFWWKLHDRYEER
ncbi:MAG TPA: DUF899 domain-containing protein [Rhodanobacteraceae bacterium]|jgi:predicted dithiol-disulfide oxidoreductase (DUF899 family)|nr:DUF899 domain-containing protein [Rhodanobacteraceae bacterium]